MTDWPMILAAVGFVVGIFGTIFVFAAMRLSALSDEADQQLIRDLANAGDFPRIPKDFPVPHIVGDKR